MVVTVGKKAKLPPVAELLARQYKPQKTEPPWVYLEREMKANLDKKPYNQKVGDWLKFLRDFKAYQHEHKKINRRKLETEVGPPWYFELSNRQIELLKEFPHFLHYDLIEDMPQRTRQGLRDFGTTLNWSNKRLLEAMQKSYEDPGLFFWYLYTLTYKTTPDILRPEYDMNSMLLMTAMLVIDEEDCMEALKVLTKFTGSDPEPEPVKKKVRPKTAPSVMMNSAFDNKPKSPYLQRLVQPPLPPPKPPRRKAEPFNYKYKLRSENQMEGIRHDPAWIKTRINKLIEDRNPSAEETERYQELLRKKREQALQAKLQKGKDKKVESFTSLEKRSQHFLVAGVVLIKGNPYYHKSGFVHESPLDTQGDTQVDPQVENQDDEDNPPEEPKKVKPCNCMKYLPIVKEYLKKTKCTCDGHLLYDYEQEESDSNPAKTPPPDNFFHPATRFGPYWFDDGEIFNMRQDEEDFIRRMFEHPIPCDDDSSIELVTDEAPSSNLLAAMLVDLGKTRLITPHLPKAHFLNRLLLWLKQRIQGKEQSEKEKKQQYIKARRRWLYLDNMNFKVCAHMILTYDEIHKVNWSYRDELGKIIKLREFTRDCKHKQFEHARLFFPTLFNFDRKFLDIFYTYLPNRFQDTHLLEMYGSFVNRRRSTPPCPLK